MAVLIDNTDRKLIPSWKPFLYSMPEIQPIKQIVREKKDISLFIHEWKENKNIANAGDLLTAAIVANQLDILEVQDASHYVLYSELEVPKPLRDRAKRFSNISGAASIDYNTITVVQRIAQLKKRLIKYPGDAILHIEIARCYLILGNLIKAEMHVRDALFLDSNNRYVVRCASRFFVHVKMKEEALKIVRRSALLEYDPWLMASEISLSQLNGKVSRNLSKAIRMTNSGDYSPFDLTELRASVGTEEYMNGAYSKSRKLFNDSLKCPNSNSLAQSNWITSCKGLNLNFESVDFESGHFVEAKSYRAFADGDYPRAVGLAKKWIDVEPYSTRTILYAYNIATNYLDDINEGIRILEEAQKTHRDNPTIINDLAYSLALNNRVDEARKIITKAKNDENDVDHDVINICLIATRGLIAFRSGDAVSGHMLYREAITRSFEHKENPTLNNSAVLNYCREILINENTAESRETVKTIIDKIPIMKDNVEITKLRSKVEALLLSETRVV